MIVSYRKIYEHYEIAVIPLNDGKYDVMFMSRTSNNCISIEVCTTEHHAVEGAKRFSVLYDIAMEEGFYMEHDGLKHIDGRDVHYSYFMDMDMTSALFKSVLNRGY
jgi:hypothetical protein